MIETISSASSLSERLREQIKNDGPITFCDWMNAALYDLNEGYYCQQNKIRWGREGDYRTSPERSSLFASTFASYFAGLHDKLGRPTQWTILEVGTGSGHFAEGVLQTLQSQFPSVFSATTYVIDEISSDTRALAQERLASFEHRVKSARLDETTIDPGIVFSNELLDAFPVHRVSLQDGQLREFYVGIGPNEDFEWALGPPSTPRLAEYLERFDVRLAEGQTIEISLAIADWLDGVSARLHRGYLITVDYGDNAEQLYSTSTRPHGTLRSFQRHQFMDQLLAQPGKQDLTTTVNWDFVQVAGEDLGFKLEQFERQDTFLLAAGLLTQLEIESGLIADDSEKLRLSTAAREMILPDGMASHFQVLVQKK